MGITTDKTTNNSRPTAVIMQRPCESTITRAAEATRIRVGKGRASVLISDSQGESSSPAAIHDVSPESDCTGNLRVLDVAGRIYHDCRRGQITLDRIETFRTDKLRQLCMKCLAVKSPGRGERRGSAAQRIRAALATCLALVTLPVGCGLNAQGHREVSAALAEYERRARETPVEYGDLSQYAEGRPSQAAPTEGTSSSPDEHSLAGLIATALERNPEIMSAIDTAKSAASRVPQATALMDPMLMTRTLPEPTRTADGDMVFVLGVSQTLPIPSKLDRRGRASLEEARMAIRDLEQTRLRTIAEVKRAYFQLFAVDQAVLITRENQTLLRDLIEVARGQLVAGKRQQEDILRAQVERSNLESQLVQLAQRRETTVALINSMLDRPPRTNVDSIASYDVRRLRPHLDELLTQAYQRNPELAKIEHQVLRDEHRLELAKLDYIPDFTVGFEWMLMQPRDAFVPPVDPNTGMRPPYNRMSEEGTDSWAITVALNIPVWFERIEAGIREARDRLSASRRQHHAAKNKLTYQIEDALARINSQRDIADLYATAIIPQAEQAYQVSREGYVTGTSDFQFVIDNWQKWLFFRLEYYRTLADLEQSIADLEQALGVSIVDAMLPSDAQDAANGE